MAGVVLASGGVAAQEQERPTEEFDESVLTEEDREEPTGESTVRPESETRSGRPAPYDDQPDERPLPLEERYDPRSQRPVEPEDESFEAARRQQRPPKGTAETSSAELPGRTIVTSSGEEVGTIEQVGYSRRHGERVATVNAGGFLGAGDKLIAIPLSELGIDGAGDVTTSLTRARIERQEAFDPEQLITAE